jgi:pterin-4a-carbinolamine dehydratase
MVDTRNDIIPVEAHQTSWRIVESPNRLMKTFEFDDYVGFKVFLDELLTYQEEVGHHGKLTIQNGNEVIVEVYTHDVDDVTEIDQEYALMADAIYEDAKILEVGSGRRNEDEDIEF